MSEKSSAKNQTSTPSSAFESGKGPASGPAPKVDNQQKDPGDWVTGHEPMTGAQASYLKTLCEGANEPFDPALSKADASRRIEALKERERSR